MNFNPEQALTYARAWSRPRRVGSGEEARVADEMVGLLESFGWRVRREAFEFVPLFNAVLILELLVGDILIALTLWGQATAWASAGAAGLLLLAASFGAINRAAQIGSLRVKWPGLRKYKTANIVADWPTPMNLALPMLYLVAHYDSKSQRLPLVWRMILFTVMLASAVLFAGLTLGQLLFPTLGAVATGAGWLALLAGIPLLFMQDTGNESPGAIDNASGAGLVAHLAECLAQSLDWQNKLRVRVLITSAEEFALMGAVAYMQAHEAELREQARGGGLYVLNFDGVGVKGKLCHVGHDNRLLNWVEAAGRELNFPLGRFNLPGALFDHTPFAEAGFEALSLVTVGRASLAVHTRGDDVDKLDVEGFRQAGEVALRVIERLRDLVIG
jgi:hypothetical protein